jgi:diamine N-acetyltransferase
MFIKSEDIYFRALEPTDVELLYSCENDYDVWKVSNTISPFSKDIILQYLKTAHQDIFTNKQLRLMICEIKTSNCIGTIDLFDFDPYNLRVGVGVLIFENYRKKGYAFQSIELIKKYTKETLLLNQLFCNINSSNIESINLFEKCGFELIGVKKKWNRVSISSFEDEKMYQIIL